MVTNWWKKVGCQKTEKQAHHLCWIEHLEVETAWRHCTASMKLPTVKIQHSLLQFQSFRLNFILKSFGAQAAASRNFSAAHGTTLIAMLCTCQQFSPSDFYDCEAILVKCDQLLNKVNCKHLTKSKFSELEIHCDAMLAVSTRLFFFLAKNVCEWGKKSTTAILVRKQVQVLAYELNRRVCFRYNFSLTVHTREKEKDSEEKERERVW